MYYQILFSLLVCYCFTIGATPTLPDAHYVRKGGCITERTAIGAHPISWAIFHGDADAVKQAFEDIFNASEDFEDEQEWEETQAVDIVNMADGMLLRTAAQRGSLEIVKTLFAQAQQCGQPINLHKGGVRAIENALEQYCETNDNAYYEIVQFIFAYANQQNNTFEDITLKRWQERYKGYSVIMQLLQETLLAVDMIELTIE